MAIWNCNGHLLGGLGICAGHNAYAATQAGLDSWAQGHSVGTFNEYSYTRPDSQSINAWAPGSIHVAMQYNDTTKVDYVMFQNTDVDSDRWYYGRVMHREYVNVNSTRLWFELDYWLTFNNEIINGLGPCLIERSHIRHDEDWNGDVPKFTNMQPEPYVPEAREKMYDEWNEESTAQWDAISPSVYVIYAATDDKGDFDYTLRSVSGVPTACCVTVCNNITELSEKVKAYNDSLPAPFYDTSNPDSIIAVTYVPRELSEEGASPARFWATRMPTRATLTRSDGRQFQNAKCFTFPYMWASAKAASGQELLIKFEEYATENGQLRHYLQGGGGVNPHYRYGCRQSTADDRLNMKYILLPDYPQIPVHSDSFAQWMACNGVQEALRAATGTFMVASGVGAIGSATKGMKRLSGKWSTASIQSGQSEATLGTNLLGDTIGNITTASHAADTMVGASNSYDAVAFNLYRIGFYLHMPSVDDLTSADDFFEAYGYTVNKYAVPNLRVRTYYTYVKTRNANVKAAIPFEGIEEVVDMLNAGCTFWDVANGEIGEYHEENPDG